MANSAVGTGPSGGRRKTDEETVDAPGNRRLVGLCHVRTGTGGPKGCAAAAWHDPAGPGQVRGHSTPGHQARAAGRRPSPDQTRHVLSHGDSVQVHAASEEGDQDRGHPVGSAHSQASHAVASGPPRGGAIGNASARAPCQDVQPVDHHPGPADLDGPARAPEDSVPVQQGHPHRRLRAPLDRGCRHPHQACQAGACHAAQGVPGSTFREDKWNGTPVPSAASRTAKHACLDRVP